MRTLQDGSIMFPRRGKPPPDLPNYDRDPGDPYHFTPKFEPCVHRLYALSTLPCGKQSGNWECTLKGILISFADCKNCQERDEG